MKNKNTIQLRDTIEQLLREAVQAPVYYQRAPKGAKYPFYVFDFRLITKDNGVKKYTLEVNAWDQHETSSRIECGMDDIEAAADQNRIFNEDRMLITYTGAREAIDDEDKTIRRIREQLEMQVCERR